ncbi:alkaline phosphatase synthesis transcriptional regulatory protein PhoP [Abditibacteriota bacterium]|nr:alkaline phosphatase synthesis transcriptional regulatory protein PhoP [Abditibacteriota bacterium]
MAFILCVDDEPSISGLVRQILRMAGHEIEVVENGPDALRRVQEREPDLIVLDRSMPGMDGLEVCRHLKNNPFLSRIPVLMLTALSSIDFKIEGFDAGADDYLGKPFEPRELTARVSALLRLVARESDRNPSSGLPGGAAIERDLEARVARGEEFSVVYFDFDHFKPFADTFGFTLADRVVRSMGEIMGELAARDGDFVAHIGGDDFLLACAPSRAAALAREGFDRFNALIAEFVGPQVAAKGSFIGLTRDGDSREFPLTSLTAVIVPITKGKWQGAVHLGELAATWKKAAKAAGGAQIVEAQL